MNLIHDLVKELDLLANGWVFHLLNIERVNQSFELFRFKWDRLDDFNITDKALVGINHDLWEDQFHEDAMTLENVPEAFGKRLYDHIDINQRLRVYLLPENRFCVDLRVDDDGED